jgi:hypothetical protein
MSEKRKQAFADTRRAGLLLTPAKGETMRDPERRRQQNQESSQHYRRRQRRRMADFERFAANALPLPCEITGADGFPLIEIRRTDEPGTWRLVVWNGPRVLKSIELTVPPPAALKRPRRSPRQTD